MKTHCIKRLSILVSLMFASSLAAAPFEPLFRVLSPQGPCQARLPGRTEFVTVQKGKAYPFGTAIRCGEAASAVLVLSAEDALQLEANTFIELTEDADNPSLKTAQLHSGSLSTRLAVDTPEKALTIKTPVARCIAMTGTVKLQLTALDESTTLTIQTEPSSTVKLIGSQYIIPLLKNGFGAKILNANDNSLTRIENLMGDYDILINKGAVENPPDMIDGVINEDLLAVETTAHCTVKIWRTHAPVGGRLIVSVLATDPNGKGKETFAFAVGQPAIASRAFLQEIDVTVTNTAGTEDELGKDNDLETAAPLTLDDIF